MTDSKIIIIHGVDRSHAVKLSRVTSVSLFKEVLHIHAGDDSAYIDFSSPREAKSWFNILTGCFQAQLCSKDINKEGDDPKTE